MYTGTTNAPIVVILFLVFNSDFIIILNLLVYSFSILLSCVVLICTHFMQSLGTCLFFCVWTTLFLCWSQVLNFASELIFLIWVPSLHIFQVQIPYGYHHWKCNYLHLFWNFVYWTVHHLDSWIKRDQLDITCFFISLFNTQHVSDVNISILRSLRLIFWVISWDLMLCKDRGFSISVLI